MLDRITTIQDVEVQRPCCVSMSLCGRNPCYGISHITMAAISALVLVLSLMTSHLHSKHVSTSAQGQPTSTKLLATELNIHYSAASRAQASASKKA